MNASEDTPAPKEQAVTMRELIEEVPPYSLRFVSDLFSNRQSRYFRLPEDVRIHCDHDNCGGVRRHLKESYSETFRYGNYAYVFVIYKCVDCVQTSHRFAVAGVLETERPDIGVKIFQDPLFGHPIPKRLFQVIGEENRAFFLQARRAIGRGLGIGAYAYYRRIVENTKFELIDSILKVARGTNAASSQIELLERAQSERQFSKAIDLLRDVSAIPPILLINGQNPLTLIHDLLSEGIHGLSDQECLVRAQEAEVILCEIADKMQIALTERKTVNAALASIMNRKRQDVKATASTPK
jgi:hypothetical protein